MGGGGGGVEARRPENDLVFFLVLNLFYSLQRGSNDFITEGGPAFSKRGYNFFRCVCVCVCGGGGGGGGVQMLISIENHIICDFPGGGGVRTPYPPSGSAQGIA